MAMQHNIHPGRNPGRWNVNEEKNQACPLQPKLAWPEIVGLVVAQDDLQRFAQRFKSKKGGRLTHISQVPDFVSCSQPLRKTGRIFIMGIGNDRDAHRLVDYCEATATPAPIIIVPAVRFMTFILCELLKRRLVRDAASAYRVGMPPTTTITIRPITSASPSES
jgi:hypothetical protein